MNRGAKTSEEGKIVCLNLGLDHLDLPVLANNSQLAKIRGVGRTPSLVKSVSTTQYVGVRPRMVCIHELVCVGV